LKNKNYLVGIIVSSLIFFLLYNMIPVYAIPGNHLLFQLDITPIESLFILYSLSLAMAVIFAMQIYIFRHAVKSSYKGAGLGLGAFVSSVISGIFASASCSLCVAALFSFLSAGSILFLVDHKLEIVIIGSVLMLISLHLTSKRMVEGCPECRIKK